MEKGYTVIQDWMLKLDEDFSITDVVAYAVIYGFSQDGSSTFCGSQKTLAERCLCSVTTIKKTLNNLESKGYITKKDVYRQGVKFCEYAAVLRGITQTDYPSRNLPTPQSVSDYKNKEEKKYIYKEQASPQVLPANKFFISSTERASVLNDPDEIAKIKRKQFYERTRHKAKELGMTKDIFLDFVGYWCEHSDGSEKLRCEKEDTFSISRRIETWLKNNKKPVSSSPQPYKAPKKLTKEEIEHLYD